MASIIRLDDLIRAHTSNQLGGDLLRLGSASCSVIEYLNRGDAIVVTFCRNSDEIDPSRIGPNSPIEWCSDGEWLWPNILSYYIREYDLPFPKSFYKHMQDQSWSIPGFIPRDKTDRLVDLLMKLAG